jgi:hypothetical protein
MSIITRVGHIVLTKSIGNSITVSKNAVLPLSRLSSSLTATSQNEIKEHEPSNENPADVLEAKRNKSKLKSRHYKILHGQMGVDPQNPLFPREETVRYRRKLIARHGLETGINLGIAWPTREELENQLEYDRVAHPFTIQEMVEKKKKLREEEANRFAER